MAEIQNSDKHNSIKKIGHNRVHTNARFSSHILHDMYGTIWQCIISICQEHGSHIYGIKFSVEYNISEKINYAYKSKKKGINKEQQNKNDFFVFFYVIFSFLIHFIISIVKVF